MDTHPQLSKANLAQVAALVRDEAGIALTEAKAPLVHSRLSRRLTALGLNDFSSYFDFVNGPRGAEERRKMLSALTTNVTRFFREPHHFEQMAQDTLPPLLDRARQGGRVRIWSAGCSSGEEPYSIAATILSLEPDAARMDIRILASDIDPEILAKARRGVYANDALGTTPVKNVERFFDVTADGLSAGAAIRELISFRELNLVREWPMKGRFDIPIPEKLIELLHGDGRRLSTLQGRRSFIPRTSNVSQFVFARPAVSQEVRAFPCCAMKMVRP